MTDPMDSLNGLQDALDAGRVQLQEFIPCALHPEVRLYRDEPQPRVMRLTYMLSTPDPSRPSKTEVRAVALFVFADPFEGLPVLQAGIAVRESSRSQGIGAKLFQQALDEIRSGFKRSKLQQFWVEAIVRQDNDQSNRIAARVISPNPKRIVDQVSGEPAFQYFLKIDLSA